MLRRIIFLLLLLNTGLMYSQVCHGKKVLLTADGACPPQTMELVFEDNFDGPFDLSKWMYTQPWGNHSQNGFDYSVEYFTDGLNYEFVDGNLNLVAKEEKFYAKAIGYEDSAFMLRDGLPNLRWWDYTSGMIYSREAFGFGKYEIRCKIPKGKSFWSVMMLFGEENHEVDVFEFWNEHDAFGRLSEEKLSSVCRISTHANKARCSSSFDGINFSEDFHTFTFFWNNNKLEFFIDGALVRTSYKFYTPLGQPVDCSNIKKGNVYLLDKTYPMNDLHISVGLSIQAGRNAPDSSTPFPSALEIDYIRYWRYVN